MESSANVNNTPKLTDSAAQVVQNPTTQPQMPNTKHLLKDFTNNSTRNPLIPVIGIALAVVLLGVGTGWVVAKVGNNSDVNSTNSSVSIEDENLADNEAGISDESRFEENTPEGILVEGGLDGEGTHHLDRGAGPDKMVYITSSVINLDSFVGKKVKVWGNTMAAQEAPWLMDVGKIKIIE